MEQEIEVARKQVERLFKIRDEINSLIKELNEYIDVLLEIDKNNNDVLE